jgi:hypothetical protein
MSSFPRLVRRGKKEKKLGRAQVVRREDLERMELEPRIEMIRALIPLGVKRHPGLRDKATPAFTHPTSWSWSSPS